MLVSNLQSSCRSLSEFKEYRCAPTHQVSGKQFFFGMFTIMTEGGVKGQRRVISSGHGVEVYLLCLCFIPPVAKEYTSWNYCQCLGQSYCQGDNSGEFSRSSCLSDGCYSSWRGQMEIMTAITFNKHVGWLVMLIMSSWGSGIWGFSVEGLMYS